MLASHFVVNETKLVFYGISDLRFYLPNLVTESLIDTHGTYAWIQPGGRRPADLPFVFARFDVGSKISQSNSLHSVP
jgi:hypothetical protein